MKYTPLVLLLAGILLAAGFVVPGVAADYATSYTYDKLGRILSVKISNGTSVDFAYDANGNRIVASISPGSVSPTVVTIAPANGATGVATLTTISATISKTVDPATVTSGTFFVTGPAGTIAGTISVTDLAVVFIPATPLQYGVSYTATVTTGVKDLAGHPLSARKDWSFTTNAVPDRTPPTVISTSPVSGALDVPVSATVSAIFSEALDQASVTDSSLQVLSGAAAIDGTVAYNGTTHAVTFTPNPQLDPGVTYTAVLLPTLADMSGNRLAATKDWQFTTASSGTRVPPAVSETTPADGETEVPVRSSVGALFSKAMDPSTITGAAFVLKNGTTTVPASVSYNPVLHRATLIPSASLASNTVYTATLAAGIKDVTGLALPSPVTWRFTTVTLTTNNPAPSITSLSPASATAGGAAFTLTVNGTNFVSTSGVKWNGSSRTTTFVSGTQLTAAITAADIAGAGTASVTVVNPSPGGGTSGAQTFAINNPAPALTLAVGLGQFGANGGWVTAHAGKEGGFALQSWLHLPWDAYNATGGGVHVAVGDVDGDGLDEIVLGLGTGGGGQIAVLDDGAHGYALLKWIQVNWSEYDSSNGEVFPAVGDIDGDGKAEIIAGLGTGSQGWVEIFDDASTGYQHLAWRQVAWPAYNAANGTTHPAVGDLDGDGKAEIVLGLGGGGGGFIEVIQSSAGNYDHGSWLQVDWPAYNASNGTTYPAVGDIDGDGCAEVVIGLGQGSGGWVVFLDDKTAGYAHLMWFQIPWDDYNSANGETHPAVGKLDADSRAEIVFGLGRFQGHGGWLFAIDDATANYKTLGWFRIPWDAFSQDGGETFPALGRPR